MSNPVFTSTAFARLMVVLSCILTAGLGVWCLSGTRDWAAHYAGFHVPAAWYAFSVVPPAIIALGSFIAPPVVLGRPGSLRLALTICVALFFASAGPLVYVVYDLNARSHAHLDATRNSQQR